MLNNSSSTPTKCHFYRPFFGKTDINIIYNKFDCQKIADHMLEVYSDQVIQYYVQLIKPKEITKETSVEGIACNDTEKMMPLSESFSQRIRKSMCSLEDQHE